MMDLTDNEKRVAVNHEVTRCWNKMLADAKRITSYNSDIFEDLLPHVISEFLTKKPIDYQYKVCCIDKKLNNYIGRSMSLNLRSSSSTFWNKYRKEAYNSRGVYIVEYDEFGTYDLDYIHDPDRKPEDMSPGECMFAAIDNLNFYFKALITDYYLYDMTLIQMNEKYGITLTSLRKDIKKGIKQIQKHCSHFVPKELK